MSKTLLDTSAYSAFMNGNESVKKWIQESEEIYINPIIIGELKAGFKKGSKEEENLDQFNRFIESPRVNAISIDEETSERYAIILNTLRNSGKPIPTNDIWIAACAMQHGLRLITTDKHFNYIPQIIVAYISN